MNEKIKMLEIELKYKNREIKILEEHIKKLNELWDKLVK